MFLACKAHFKLHDLPCLRTIKENIFFTCLCKNANYFGNVHFKFKKIWLAFQTRLLWSIVCKCTPELLDCFYLGPCYSSAQRSFIKLKLNLPDSSKTAYHKRKMLLHNKKCWLTLSSVSFVQIVVQCGVHLTQCSEVCCWFCCCLQMLRWLLSLLVSRLQW